MDSPDGRALPSRLRSETDGEGVIATAKQDDGLTKFQRYRRTRHARGMKLLRVWVDDPKADGFRAEASRQATLLRGSAEEVDALEFIHAAADWPAP